MELPRYIKSHLRDARIRQLSQRTIQECGIYLSKLPWFLQHENHPVCDTEQLRGSSLTSHWPIKISGAGGMTCANGSRYA